MIIKKSSIWTAATILLNQAVQRGVFCQFHFRWIYYYSWHKSTRKKTDKTHLCAVPVGIGLNENSAISVMLYSSWYAARCPAALSAKRAWAVSLQAVPGLRCVSMHKAWVQQMSTHLWPQILTSRAFSVAQWISNLIHFS